MNKSKSFVLIGCLWLSIIAAFVVTKEYTLRTGAEILLKTRPVDPRDLFRGDYVILSYDISRFNAGDMQSSLVRHFRVDDQVYVTLDMDGEYSRIKQVHYDPPRGEIYLKGRVVQVHGDQISLEYGIESYFVPEGEGKLIERRRNGGRVDVLAAVDRRGHVMIKKLLMDNVEVRFD